VIFTAESAALPNVELTPTNPLEENIAKEADKAAANLRDSIGGTIYSGTSDIQRNVIARLLGL